MPVIKQVISVFIILLIYSNETYTQSLGLKIQAENIENTRIIDSINYNKTFENYIKLQTELNNLKLKLSKIGYIDSDLQQISKPNDTLFLASLFLGKKTNTIRVSYDSSFDPEFLNLIPHTAGKSYFELDIEDLESSLNTLNSKIAEQGDPFSTLQLTDLLKFDTNTISAKLKIITNQKRRIDKIIVKGYEKFPKSYVKRFLKLKTGKSFNLNAIKDKVELLNNIQFANKIKDPEVLFTQDSTTLYIYVEKTKTNNFDGFLGFGTNEDTNKLEFDGYLDLRLINNLNYGETINLLYKSDEIDQQTFKVDVDLPYLFSSPVGLQVGLNLFKKDSTFLNASQYAKINYLLNAEQKIGLGVTSTKSTNLLEDDTTTLNDYTTNYFTISYNYSKLQSYDPLFPVNFYLDFSSGFGDRTNDFGAQKQMMFNIESFKIFSLNNKNSIFTKISGAILTSNNYLDNELFRFGGINSIRGFEENSLVANLYGVLNTEYRYRLSNNLYVHSVIDAAYFENQLTDSKEKLYGFGFGLGLLTNAGLFRLNYSSGKTENRPFKLSDSKVHISLTATF